MSEERAQVVIVGGGSAGYGALYALAKEGIRTVLIEKNEGLGGTSVFAGVNCYEPGVSCGSIHSLLANHLLKKENAAAVCKSVEEGKLLDENSTEGGLQKFPWRLSVPDKEATYEDTLRSCPSLTRDRGLTVRRFHFEPEEMQNSMMELLQPYMEYVTLHFATEYVSCKTEGRKITEVTVKDKEGTHTIKADFFIDASGDIVLARDAGCDVSIGFDAKEKHGEPSASIKDETGINGVTYSFRICKDEDPEHVDNLKTSFEITKPIAACYNVYPNGDMNVNMLPTMTGKEFLSFGEDADAVGKERVYGYWNWMQKEKGLKGYRLDYIFPQAGIRESYRLNGRHTLTEQEIHEGLLNQKNRTEIIAIADHGMDTHGGPEEWKEVKVPYGIPFSCMLPKEFDNMLVSCRGASFSHIAASSARLSRTMLSMGEAAGNAVAMLVRKGKIDFERLQKIMKIPI